MNITITQLILKYSMRYFFGSHSTNEEKKLKEVTKLTQIMKVVRIIAVFEFA
jgi:hypothetical protein